MQQGTDLPTPKGWMLSKGNKLHGHHTHTTCQWAYIRARRQAPGCTMVPILVVHSCSSTTISEGGGWGRVSYGLYDEIQQGFPRRALLAAPKEERPTYKLRPMDLPRLARPKGCFATYYSRSIDKLSGRTTGRLGYDRPDSAYAIGGMAELALRSS
jgi:hypothetical protein